ncbi:MAG: hypothetical protein AB7O59_01015 [Pirellulales bacterium]
MPHKSLAFTNAHRRVPTVRVFLRAGWVSTWVENKHLFCNCCQFVANPDLGKAQFAWEYGRVLRPGAASFEFFDKLDVLRQLVKVEIENLDDPPNPITWYGTLEESSLDDRGLVYDGDTAKPAGRQTLVAYAIDFLIARHVITTGYAMNAEGAELKILRGLEFNAKSQLDSVDEKVETGNRTANPGPKGVYLFATDLSTAKFWNTFDAGWHLLKYHTPPADDGTVVIPWEFDIGALAGTLPDWDKPRVATHARTLRDVLNQLIDRRRLIGFTPTIIPGAEPKDDRVQLRTFTFAAGDVTFEGNTIPANSETRSLVFDADAGLAVVSLKRHTLEEVEQVICTGARAVACFTVSPQKTPANLVPGWTNDQKTQYDGAASLLPGYGSMEEWKKEHHTKRIRALDNVARVYSYFNLPVNWNGGAFDVQSPSADENYDQFEGDIGIERTPFYYSEARLLSHLSLKTDHDYAGDNIHANAVVDTTPTGQKWEYRPLLVAIKLPKPSPAAPDEYQVINALSVNTEIPQPSLGTEDGIKWSASVRPQQDAPGIVITVQGQPQHVIAQGDFVKLPEDEDVAKFDWHTLVATVAMQTDRHTEGRWPAAPPAFTDCVRRLIIAAGDDFQEHYVAAGTVVRVSEEGGLEQTDGGYIRDDRDKLTALARLVYEWYATQRQQLELNFGYFVGTLAVGNLITTIGLAGGIQNINTVVTMVKFEFSQAEGSTAAGSCHTSVTTDFAELDVKHFIGD